MAKGFNIIDEFNCNGQDTVGPLKRFGGKSKGGPNEEDLKNAERFGANARAPPVGEAIAGLYTNSEPVIALLRLGVNNQWDIIQSIENQ